MKVIFINPPTQIGYMSFIHKQYPLNIMTLASYLRLNGIEAAIVDFNVEKFSSEIIKQKMYQLNPDIVGFTAYTSTIHNAAHIATLVKEYNAEIKTIIGGIHASALPVRTLHEFPCFDFLIYGEGERTLLHVIEAMKNGGDLITVKGLAYRKNNEVIMNEPRDLIDNIDEIPFPARNLIPKHLYRGTAFRGFLSQSVESDFIITSRGCPGRCKFCASNIVYQGEFRMRSARNILDEIKECADIYGTKHIVIMDDTFTTSTERLFDFCDGIKHLGIQWNCFGRVDLVNEEKIKIMAESGCKGIQFGVESGSQRILDLMNKGITIEQIKKAFQWAHQYTIITDASIMVGWPDETDYDIDMTYKLLKEIKPKMLMCSLMIPFPGTEVNKMMKEKGYIKDENWNDYVLFGKKPPPYRTDHFTFKELRKKQNKLIRMFYLRPSFIMMKLLSIRSFKELLYWFKIGIDFIKEVIFNVSEKQQLVSKGLH